MIAKESQNYHRHTTASARRAGQRRHPGAADHMGAVATGGAARGEDTPATERFHDRIYLSGQFEDGLALCDVRRELRCPATRLRHAGWMPPPPVPATAQADSDGARHGSLPLHGRTSKASQRRRGGSVQPVGTGYALELSSVSSLSEYRRASLATAAPLRGRRTGKSLPS